MKAKLQEKSAAVARPRQIPSDFPPTLNSHSEPDAAAYGRARAALMQEGNSAYQKRAAVEALRELADAGSTASMNALAYAYRNGVGTKADPTKALCWCRRAAERGDAHSMVFLATYLTRHPEAGNNPHEAEHWYLKVGETGHPFARLCLARFYLSQERYADALPIFEKLAEEAYAPAMYWLGWLHTKGRGVPRDLHKARDLLARSAALGNIEGKIFLGKVLMQPEFSSLTRLKGLAIRVSGAVAGARLEDTQPDSPRLV